MAEEKCIHKIKLTGECEACDVDARVEFMTTASGIHYNTAFHIVMLEKRIEKLENQASKGQ